MRRHHISGFILLLVGTSMIAAASEAVAQPTVNLTIADTNAAEAGQDPGSFTVTRTADGGTGSALNVWVTVGGTAAQLGPDYSTTNLSFRGGTDYSITIDGGQVSKTVTLTPVRDNLAEGSETFTVVLRGPGDAGHDYTIGGMTQRR